MDEVIEALTIFRKYANPAYPFHCEYDTLMVLVAPALVSTEDKQLLERLGFIAQAADECFVSYRYGSA